MTTTSDGSFAGLWDGAVAGHRDRPFLLFRHRSGLIDRWTYGEFDRLTEGVAATLAGWGVGPGSTVQLVLANCPAFVAVWLAVSRLGAVMVPVDPASTTRDIERQVRRTAPVVVVCAQSRRAVVDAGADRAARVVALTETAADLAAGSPLLSADGPVEPILADPAGTMALMFTSGTTSEPKAVTLTQANYRTVATTMAALAGLEPSDRWYVCLPLFHANAQYYCFAAAIAVGASVGLTARFTASRWPHEAVELEATHASLFAAPIRMILARRRADAPALALRHVWFAQNLARGQWEELAELCGTRPRQIYGMTETLAVVTANPADRPDPASIGAVVDGREVALVNPATGAPAAEGEPGILTVAGRPGVDLFAGYRDNPAANARAFPELSQPDPGDGRVWFSTGDLARRRDDGQLVFVGRVDDVVKVAGENVSLTEVEAAVAEAPGVLEAAVVAEADPIRDLVPVAFVVPRDRSRPPTPADLDAWAERNLTAAARPRRWTIIEELPRTSVGKLRRFQLNLQPSTDKETS